jgi:WD40 repeat protein
MGYPAIIPVRVRGILCRLHTCWLAVMVSGLAACSPNPQPVVPVIPTQTISVTNTLSPSPLPEELHPSTSTVEPPAASPTVHPTSTVPAGAVPITADNAPLLQQVGQLRYDPWDLVLALAWSPDGNVLAVAAGNSICLYAGSDLDPLQTLQVGAWTTGLAFSPDSSSLAAGSRDGELRVWHKAVAGQNFDAQPAVQWAAHLKGTNQIAFSPDGSYLASGGNDAIARVWNAADGSQAQQMIGGTFSVPALAFRPDGEYLAVVNGSLARLREIESGRIGVTLRADASLLSLDFSPNGQWIATGNLNNQLEIWEAATGARIRVLSAAGMTGSAPAAFIGRVVYSPDGSLLGSTSSDGSVHLWEPARERPLISLDGHSRAATGLAFAPDQTRLASAGLDAMVRIWGIP